MFKNLTIFGYDRTWKQSIGFYIAYLFLALLLGMLAGGIYSLVTGDDSFEGGMRTGQIMSIFYCIALAVSVAYQKCMLSSFKVIVLVLATGIIAIFTGALGGLIPVSYLCTVKGLHNKSLKTDTGADTPDVS